MGRNTVTGEGTRIAGVDEADLTLPVDRLPVALNLDSISSYWEDRPLSVPRPAALHSTLPARLGGRIAGALRQEADYGHLFLWMPAFMGAGAAAWLSANTTPALTPLLSLCAASAAVWFLLGPARVIFRRVAMAFLLVFSGALLAALETARRDTVILDGSVTTTVSGIIAARQIDSTGRWRYDIAVISTERPVLKRPPSLVRLTALRAARPLALGSGIRGRARLSPPSGPALPGLNDFAFDAYFAGFGAIGFFYGHPEQWTPPAGAAPEVGLATHLSRGLERLRGAISARIRSVLPGDTGAFAASMVTDDRRAISRPTAEALRRAGLAHIVAISGLNMALAAGLCFVGLRLGLSLSQTVAHRWPVKQIAAAGALLTVTLYYLISGFAVSAERAYIMMAIMLTAAFLGRPSISLRNVALSAIIMLTLTPSALMGPGFQMSFAATLALVAGYSAWQRRANRLGAVPVASLARLAPAWHFMVGIFMTSLIGGLSTALYSVEHFHRIAAWGLPANLLAMPVISFVVMPAGLAALILMPFGLDWLPLVIMGAGLDIVIAVARWAASLGGDIVVGRIPAWFFLGGTLGLLALAIMRSNLRALGVLVFTVLFVTYLVLPEKAQPDLIVFEDGQLAGLPRDGTLAISDGRPSAFILEQWQRALRADTIVKPQRLPAMADADEKTDRKKRRFRRLTEDELRRGSADMRLALESVPISRFACRDKHWCVARSSRGATVVIAINGAYAGAACDLADIVITPARLKWRDCRSGARLISGETLRESGSLEIFLARDGGHPRIAREVGAMQGHDRPWSRHRRYDWRSGTYAGEG